jgi:hypothetical protein
VLSQEAVKHTEEVSAFAESEELAHAVSAFDTETGKDHMVSVDIQETERVEGNTVNTDK